MNVLGCSTLVVLAMTVYLLSRYATSGFDKVVLGTSMCAQVLVLVDRDQPLRIWGCIGGRGVFRSVQISSSVGNRLHRTDAVESFRDRQVHV